MGSVAHRNNAMSGDREREPLMASVPLNILDSEANRDEQRPKSIVVIVKILYFLSGLSGSTWGRYATIFYVTKGLSPFEIGFIGCICPFIQTIGQPLWGILSDRCRNRKGIYMATSTLATLCILSLSNDWISDSYVKITLVACMEAAFVSGGILDAYAIDELKKRGKLDDYGKLRVYLAISWGLGTCFMGYISDDYGFGVVFWVFGIFQFINLCVLAVFVPSHTDEEKRVGRTAEGKPRMSVLIKAMTRPRVLCLLLLLTVFGCGFGIVDRLLFVYLMQSFNASKFLCGLTVGCTVLMELPIFYYGKYVLQRIGPQTMMTISMCAFIVRMFGYTYLTTETVHYVLLLELMHGITFGLMWTATISIVSQISPPGWGTATMTIVQTTLRCLGAGTGALVGGWAAEKYGFKPMFWMAGYLFCGVLAIHLLFGYMSGFELGEELHVREVKETISTTVDEEKERS
ncbi:hypothetical protein SARC_01234 [Sphaeroforma arctica JP610]|uniref:Major facilitator superfamily (MFS) profile domain-containing protein n=1 Tax=Sphaeroforma arctica JP610 TaxID=667725 RepID=A0A0L0GCH8_9EUKA|nr:hypothetical protein SARC_01234 [Sphaeroforma arctica JP610]KNC86604.1 hypothetical protein SARC_01234 [Sphaeroforma arctica JP610]|eukprot:XP_014160506.1 hypothetical protein SARC_01234 [Sphaeroforma arctica JP610]